MSATAQSKFMSAVESVGNVLVGFGINFVANLLVLPAFGFNVTASDAFNIGLVMTAVSVARSFYLRRAFEWVRVRYGNFDPWGKVNG